MLVRDRPGAGPAVLSAGTNARKRMSVRLAARRPARRRKGAAGFLRSANYSAIAVPSKVSKKSES